MDETETLLRETARVAAGAGIAAARGARDDAAVARCRRIECEAAARLGRLPAGNEPPAAEGDRGIRSTALGMAALGEAMACCPDADADARGLASRLLVLLRAIQDGIIRAQA